MRTSDSIQKISVALAKALPEIQNATKDAKNPAYRSTYATLNSVMDAVKPALFEQGIVVVQGPGWRDGIVTVTTRFLHESGEWIETEAGAPVAHRFEKVDGTVTDKGPDAQTAGSAISYLRRYSLAAMAGITQEDDDGNAASGNGHSRPAQTGKAAAAATAKQTALIERLAKSSKLTEKERDGIRSRLLNGMTKQQASDAIEWLNEVMDTRDEAPTENGADPSLPLDDKPKATAAQGEGA